MDPSNVPSMKPPAGAAARLRQWFRWPLGHRAFLDSIRPSDVFVVTYPRSGTTWLRYLIANVLAPAEDVTFSTFRNYVPDINDTYAARTSLDVFLPLSTPRFFSFHGPYDPALPKVVYLLRDPRDVMISFYHYRRTREQTYSGSLHDFLRSDDHYPCPWDQHVTGWLLNGVNDNICLIRYEELQRDTLTAVRRVLDFADVHCKEDDIARAVTASGFDEMRSAEERYTPDVSVTGEEKRFVRRGKIGGYADELDLQSIRIIEEKYGRVMRVVGYEPSS